MTERLHGSMAANEDDDRPPSIDFGDVEAAARRLSGAAHRTPLLSSASTGRRLGAEVLIKPENLQRTGSFKFRGAYNAVALAVERGAGGVVAYSSGNHAQAVALAGHLHGVETMIVMPTDAPAVKRSATEGYGARVVDYDRFTEDRAALAHDLAVDHDFALVPPFDDPAVMAGQGTATLELFADGGGVDVLFVCVGGGGLISGAATVAKHLNPDCVVIGVEPETGDDARQSLAAGRIVTIEVPKTIADGAQTTSVGAHTFSVMRRSVDAIETVSDAELVEAMRWAAERLKLVIEPTGALALAGALAAEPSTVAGRRVGVLISGGNIDVATFARLLGATTA